jgi:hypothetical protein
MVKAQREPSAVGGALHLRLEVGGNEAESHISSKLKAESSMIRMAGGGKGITFFLNQLINELTNQPDQIEP